MSPSSLEELARRLGVSRRTLSRVRAGGKNVAPALKKRLEEELARVDYTPNVHAVRLAAGRVPVLALVFPRNFLDTLDDYVARVIKGALQGALPLQHQVTLIPYDRLDAQRALKDFRSRLAGEFVFVAFGPQDGAELRVLREKGVPFSVVNFRAEGVDSYDCDNVLGGRLATEHLLQQGRNRIAFLNGDDAWMTSRERREGYEDVLRRHNLPVRPEWILPTWFEPRHAAAAAEHLLSLNPRVDAIFAANDITSIAAYGALRRRGVRVPEDVALIGFDDTPVCSLPILETSLSSVSQPLEDIARAAAERAIALAARRADPAVEHRLFPPLLKARESSTHRRPPGAPREF